MMRAQGFLRWFRIVAAAPVLALTLGAAAARADVKAGEVISRKNAGLVKDLVSPGVEWCINRGMSLKIGEYKKIDLPKAYRDATEKYSSQVKLAADGLKLEGYVAGLPFPTLDPNDPKIATKVMWNYEYRWGATDDSDARNFDADTGPVFGGSTPMSVERHFLLDHIRRLRYVGRLYVDPKPTWESKEGYQGKSGLHPILEPFDLKGVGGISHRYLDPGKHDETWLYLPSLRRVRRLSTAQRSDALFGQDIDVDSFSGYDGHIAWMDWKFLGEKQMLGAYHGENYPVKWGPGGADFAFDDVWEKRPTYVVEGVSKLAQYAYGKRIIFLDKEAMTVSYSDIYDRTGALWKVYVNLFSMRKQPFAGAKLSVYEDEMPFNPGVFMVDTQLQHATRVALPSSRYQGEEGWYFNLGEKAGTAEEWFTIANLIESGR
ncbi:MAG: DUF1329 domain-containing protein [Candidatus Binatia bacterium]